MALNNGYKPYLYSTLQSSLPSVTFDKEVVHLVYCDFNCKPLQSVIIHSRGIFHPGYLMLLLNFAICCPCFLERDCTFFFFLSTLSLHCCSRKSLRLVPQYKVRLYSPDLWTSCLRQEAPALTVCTLRRTLDFPFSFPGPTGIIFTSGTLLYLNQSQNN